MFPQLYTAASGMVAGEQTLEIVSGNLANARTPGYRPDRPMFAEYLSEVLAARVPGGRPVAPNGVLLASSWRADEQGQLQQTGNDFDLALEGPGWFRIGTPNGERLSRAGIFTRALDGRLTTDQGNDVLDTNGKPIRLPEGRLVVTPDGSLTVDGAVVARIGLAEATAQALLREGESLWAPQGPVKPLPPGRTRVAQGYIEESGVNATAELVNLITAQRLYEMQQKLLDLTANTLARKAIELGEPR
jgi:flagellar basal body rod protein FlgG